LTSRFCLLDFPIAYVGRAGCTENSKRCAVYFIDVKIRVRPVSAHIGHSELSPEKTRAI